MVLMFCRENGVRLRGLILCALCLHIYSRTFLQSSSEFGAVLLMQASPSLLSLCARGGVGKDAHVSLGFFDMPDLSRYACALGCLPACPGLAPVLGVFFPVEKRGLALSRAFGISSRVCWVSTMRRPVVWGLGVT